MSNRYDLYWKKKFSRLENQIFRYEARLSAILTEALTNPKTSPKYWRTVRASINKQYKKISGTFNQWAKLEIPKSYRTFLKMEMKRVSKLKSITREAKVSVGKLVNTTAARQITAALTKDAIRDMSEALVRGNRRIIRLTRMTQQTLVSEAFINSAVGKAFESGNIRLATIMSRKGTLANKLVEQAKNGRWVTIIDKNKKPRSYRASYYSEMVTRVKFHESQAAAALTTAKNYDTDLVRVSNHNTTTAICQEFEGKIFSISGKDKRFPVLTQVPPFHVNCLHYITATFVESLEAQGAVKGFSDFSLGKTEQHPTDSGFIPIAERAAA